MPWENMQSIFRPEGVHQGVMKSDPKKCTRTRGSSCQLCWDNCPFRAWTLTEGQEPRLAEGHYCFSCSNCMVACPRNAISVVETYHVDSGYFATTPSTLESRTPAKPLDTDGNAADWTVIEKAVLNRRSVRNFKDKPVPEHLIRRILEAGRFAPSAGNCQPWKFIVLTDKALMEEITHGTFMKEGTMVAFPTCFPGASVPIVADESRITALDATPEGIIYGGTSGHRSHVFVAMFHGATGMVFDLKSIEGATDCVAVCCGKEKVLACVNGWQDGGRILATKLQPLPYDCIQEWFVDVKPFERGADLPGERITAIERDARGRGVVVLTSRGLASWAPSKPLKRGPDAAMAAMARDGAGKLLGVGRAGVISEIVESASGFRVRKAGKARGNFSKPVWSGTFPGKPLYLADSYGIIFEVSGRKPPKKVGRAPLAPISCMAVSRDGRLFGFCGEEISHMFEYDPAAKKVRDIGVALSLLNRRRYGYEFGCAAANRDGHVLFGERDRGGHMWLYFPRVQE